jgi:hypothetical protein
MNILLHLAVHVMCSVFFVLFGGIYGLTKWCARAADHEMARRLPLFSFSRMESMPQKAFELKTDTRSMRDIEVLDYTSLSKEE